MKKEEHEKIQKIVKENETLRQNLDAQMRANNIANDHLSILLKNWNIVQIYLENSSHSNDKGLEAKRSIQNIMALRKYV